MLRIPRPFMLFGPFVSLFLLFATPVTAANVKITPLGSHDGEFCGRDRAFVFEDPDGTRLLYDAGQTVAGADDRRLGKIDVVLVSHMHGDHVGNNHIKQVNAGECGKPDTSVSALPNTNSVNIAMAKKLKSSPAVRCQNSLPANSRHSALTLKIHSWCVLAHQQQQAALPLPPCRQFIQTASRAR